MSMAEYKAMRVAYGEALAELGGKNEKIVALDADLAHATMSATFAKKYPERFFNAGIAEANMVGMAAGLSTMGFVPFVSTFAMFGAGRAYEQIRNSVAYPKFNVKLAFTHSGITLGEDGGSHQTVEDIALMRVIPNMTVIAPCDANQTKKAVQVLAESEGPAYLRLARLPSLIMEDMDFKIGGSNIIAEGSDAVIFTCGIMVEISLNAAKLLKEKGINVSIINLYSIKPLDRATVVAYANKCKKVIVTEEHSIIGGLCDAVAEVLVGSGEYKFRKIGIMDRFGQSGKPKELLVEYGLTSENIMRCIMEM